MFAKPSPSGALQPPEELDDLLRSSFELIAEATCVLAGFGAVSLLARVGEGLRVVAVGGSEEARAALLDEDIPLDHLEAAVRGGERHGLYFFMPDGAERAAELEEHSWLPPIAATSDPRGWQPEDTLIAPLHDDDGQVVGALSMDLPVDGRRPGEADWDRLQVYAEHARAGLLIAFERSRVAQRLHQLEVARDLVREAIRLGGEGTSLEPALRRVGATLLSHFGVAAAWCHLFDAPGRAASTVETCGPRLLPLPHRLAPYAGAVARRLWEAQEPAVLGRRERVNVDGGDARAVDLALAYLAEHEAESMLYAPLGMAAECFGLLVLVRTAGDPAWSEVECEAIAEIGRDLGVLVAGALARRRDEDVLADLRDLEAYKSRLVATVSHELRNPLAALRTNLELLQDTADRGEAQRVVAAVRRSTDRISAIVTDLEGLGAGARVGTVPREADLREAVRQACDVGVEQAAQRGLRLTCDLPAEPVRVHATAVELDRVVGNLVSNAVKYSGTGGTIRLALEVVGTEAVLSVADEGIGIAAPDRGRVFEEFFRAEDPAARAQPGTGLGLAIVRGIVERRGGRIEVESEPGRGSTFCVLLPCAETR